MVNTGREPDVSEAKTRIFESVAPRVGAQKFAHQLFEEQAARAPRQLAVACRGAQMTYAELNSRANQLARRLRTLGVGPDTVVAISVVRSLEMVVGILGVLKAGGAYVPLDPAYPKERLEFMIADSRPAIFLTHSHLVKDLPDCEAPKLLLDAISYATRNGSTENLSSEHRANDLAYVIYTSGSTGKPKGVMITHGNLGRYVQSMRSATDVSPSDVYLHTASISFSSSVRQLLLPLSVGATVVVATTDEIRDPIALFTTIKQLGVTVIDLVPSYWRNCVDALKSVEPATRTDLLENNLRLVLSASEPLLSDVPRAWKFELNHQAQLINMFGQTETTGIVTTQEIVPRDENNVNIVPIGKPIDGVRIYLLNSQLKPVETSDSGEICIGGPMVGLGYLNQPELTAEKFPHDPFAENSAARLYRTGDRGRLRSDGTLEFQGRIDHQVKIRGHRVEPAEIENSLLEHRSVREVVVIASEDQPGNARLVAYVAPQRFAAPTISGRERYLLPNNMAIADQNKHETDFFYQQIFADQTNFRHGISLADGACVFDVGANIGFFTLFVQQIWQNVRVYAFEPIPPIFETLQVNASLYGNDVRLFQCGLAREPGEAEFTFYPDSTTQSGRYADAADEREVLRSIIGNTSRGDRKSGATSDDLEAIIDSRVSGQQVNCKLRTVSEIMLAEKIERIDLLKIDVEKSELDVLAGIAEDDWEKIQQVVIEAHDVNGQLEQLIALLTSHGYSVIAEQDHYLKGSNLYNVYATRKAILAGTAVAEPPFAVPVLESSLLSPSELRGYLQGKLPDYLIPAEIVLVESLPRLPNGKIDLQALKCLDRQQPASSKSFAAPLSPVEEQLARIWSEVLKRDQVSINDNFFDLGGDSILVMQIVSRAARAGLRFTPKQIFKQQTIAELAATLKVAEAVTFGSQREQ
jgi:amino acid adenylation domain-containing protein/FkbM family methyltransferase